MVFCTCLAFIQKQARRVYEILRLRVTDVHNSEQYRRYRLDVKNRLNIPYQVRQHRQESGVFRGPRECYLCSEQLMATTIIV
jgi:hypothetical protein